MPEIGKIQSTNFQALLQELGISRNNIPFALRSEVTPVVLVGGTVSFVAAPIPAYGVTDIFTAGILTNPAGGTVLADTGPLPLGAYSLQLVLFGEASNTLDLQWRNAANAANLWTQRFTITTNAEERFQFSSRFDVLNANERFRLLVVAAGGAGIDYQASILAKA